MAGLSDVLAKTAGKGAGVSNVRCQKTIEIIKMHISTIKMTLLFSCNF